MNILDVIILILLLVSVWRGYRQGLVGQLVRLASFIVSFVVAFIYYRPFAAQLAEWLPLSKLKVSGSFGAVAGAPLVQHALYNIVAFALLAFVAGAVVRLIGGLLEGIADLPVLSIVNRLAGAVIGFVKIGLVLFLILAVASVLPVPTIQQTLNHSLFASYAASSSSDLLQWIKELIQNPLSMTNGTSNSL
jgi:uncharacterized membrane protein required for colicin V production